MWLQWLCAVTAFTTVPLPALAGVAHTPPRLERQPERVVWYQLPNYESRTKFILHCEGSGDPEEYIWYKNGKLLEIGGRNPDIHWLRPGQSGTITFTQPLISDEGYYQCHVKNIFGRAVSNKAHVRRGSLGHFHGETIKDVYVDQLDKLNLSCPKLYGEPKPQMFWLFRDEKLPFVMETIKREHITVDGDGDLLFSYVQKHDGRDNLLYQCAAQSPAMQGEHRAGPQYRVHVSDKRAFNFAQQKLMWHSPPEMEVTAGDSLSMMCIFGGYPVTAPTWSRVDGQELPKDRLDTDNNNFGKSLIINHVRPSDAGQYECRVNHLSHVITVTVTAAPYWLEGPPKDVTRPEASTAELKCDAGGDPAPLIRWYINAQPLDSVLDDKEVVVMDNGKVLRITHLDHDKHRAVYQCNASNPLGYVFANAYVNVRAFPPKFSHPANRTIKTTRSSRIDIDCDVDAAPLPIVKLVDTNDRIVKDIPGKLRTYHNNTIRIMDVQFDDAGLYYCNVSNKYGTARAVTMVEVYEPTILDKVLPHSPQIMDAHQSINLSCSARTDERLTAEYDWLLDGQLLDIAGSKHYRLVEPNKLEIIGARGRHSGKYECVAQTVVDNRTSAVQIVVNDVPDKVEWANITCDVSDRQVILQWQAANDNHDPVQKYIVEQSTGFKPGVWKEMLVDYTKSYPDGKVFYNAQLEASPWVNYTYRVIAVNGHGPSEPSLAPEGCNKAAAHPYTNPERVTANGDAPDNLVITWVPMDKEDWNGEKFHYFVRYRLDEPGAKWTEFDIEDPLMDHTVIREQPTYRRYQVMVGARNAIGMSLQDPKIITGYSGEDVPVAAPSNFREVTTINATSIKFAWEHVSNDTINGNFIGYKVVVKPMLQGASQRHKLAKYRGSEPRVVSKTVNFLSNELTIIDLRPMQTYEAFVVALNTQFQGPPSNTISFAMPEGIPSEVTNLMVRPWGSRTIRVTWGEPLYPLGILRGYFLTFYNTKTTDFEETFVDINRNLAYIFEEAIPDSNYEVSVWAETGGGEGPNVSAIVHTWPLIDPGQPEIATSVIDESTVRATWLPSDVSLPGTSAYFNYSIKGTGVWQQTKVIKIPEHSLTIDGLSPSRTYWIAAVAQDDQPLRTCQSALYRVEIPPASYVRAGNDYMTSAAWFIAILCAVAVALLSLVVVCIRQNRGEKYSVKKKELERAGAIGFTDQDEERTFMEYQYGPNYTKDDDDT